MNTDAELIRCAAEQTDCGDYIRSGGPDQRGALRGAADWLMEEAIIRLTSPKEGEAQLR